MGKDLADVPKIKIEFWKKQSYESEININDKGMVDCGIIKPIDDSLELDIEKLYNKNVKTLIFRKEGITHVFKNGSKIFKTKGD